MSIENARNKENDEKKENDKKKEEIKQEKKGFHQETLLLKTNIKIERIISDIRFFRHISISNWSFTTNNEKNKGSSDEKDKQKFTDYVIKGKLGSGEDSNMEEIYNELVYFNREQTDHSLTNNIPIRTIGRSDYTKLTHPEARKLKYIMDNREKDMEKIIEEIEELEEKKLEEKKEIKSDTARPINKKEIELIPQSLKNLINKGYTYLIIGKELIVKEASGAIKDIGEFVGGIFRSFIDFGKIKSSPAEKNPRTGVTQCSATAQKNANNFGIKIPNGNAKEGVHKPIEDKEHFINNATKQGNNNSYINIEKSAPENANFADLSVESDTPNGKKYGHRAVAFMNNDGQRYVLDPYYSGGYNTKPIPRNKYPKHNKAEKINFYNAPKQSISA